MRKEKTGRRSMRARMNVTVCGAGVVYRGEAAVASSCIHKEPRSRSEKSAADAKLEKTSLSAGGFLRVPNGFGIGLWLHTR